MARKTKEDAEHTHTALLDAAEQVFYDRGVSQTTLNDIATAAGMTRGAIYWHFKDKTALLQALFDRAMLPMEALLTELSGNLEADPLGTMRQIMVKALTTLAQSERQQKVNTILLHRCENTGDAAKAIAMEQQHREECFCHVVEILAKAVQQGQLPLDTDISVAAHTLHAFMVGTIHEWLQDTQRYCLLTQAPAMVDMLLAGLRACPPRTVMTPLA
jgi:TetR/AcrR family acrAB operon transcriptional repressor